MSLISKTLRLPRGETGATAIEYALICALIALAIVGAMTTIGTKAKVPFESVSAKLK